MKLRKIILLMMVVLNGLNGLTAFAQITSTFNSNAEGWTTPNDADGTIAYSATGGNPGGFVFGSPFVFNLGAGSLFVPFTFVAPGTYLGNRSAYYNGTLRYDIQLSAAGTPNQYAEVTIANNADTLYYFPPVSNQPAGAPAWSTFSVTLNNALGYWKTTNSATGAAASEAQVQSILTALVSLQIRGLYRDANNTSRLDNVSFRPPLVITTQPVSRIVCDGITTTLNTAATGNANITYQWQKQNIPATAGWSDLTNTGGYSGATTATLSVNTTGNFGAGTYRCKISGTAVDDAFTTTVTITVNANPSAPTTTGNASCVATSLTLSAAGGTAGQYRWYTVATGGTAIIGQTNSTYTTPVINTTTTYYISINNSTCESARTPVVATITTTPSAPITTGNSSCGPSAVTLNAAGGTAGQYRWYTVATGGTALAGQTNNTYTTPVITTSTTYYVSINNGTCEGARTPVTATINTSPGAPATTGNSSCGAAAITLSATGGTAGQYRWYTLAAGGTAIAGQTNNTYTTPVITTTTTYYVSINNGTCESTRTAVVADIIPLPAKPTIISSEPITGGVATLCLSPITLTAPAGFTSYTWSNGQTSRQITTIEPGNYSVVVREANGCASLAADIVQIINSTASTCINNPPVISSTSAITTVGGSVSIDLSSLLSDPDNNLDLASLQIVGNGTSKGGNTSLEGLTLEIDYNGLKFAGEDNVTIRICDLLSVCIEQLLTIDVIGDINVYNGISPNGDDKNDKWIIEYIDLFPDTQKNKVTIYNRWGDVVWEASDYNNTTVVFSGMNKNGNELSTGSYFYKIEFTGGRDTITGYLSLKR